MTLVAIGDRDGIGLYRDLLQADVNEYIVVGARGGVGTTTLAINLAWYLSNRQKRRVLLLDLDLRNGNCALALDGSSTPGLTDALANPQRIDSVFLKRAIAIHSERLFVLSAEEPLTADVKFPAGAVETLVRALQPHFHYIIADVQRLPGALCRRSLDIADIRIIVADQTLCSVRDRAPLQALLGANNATHRNLLVINRGGEGSRYAMTLDEMAKVDMRPKIVIPFRPKLCAAARLARPGRFTVAIAALTTEICGHKSERTSRWRSAR